MRTCVRVADQPRWLSARRSVLRSKFVEIALHGVERCSQPTERGADSTPQYGHCPCRSSRDCDGPSHTLDRLEPER